MICHHDPFRLSPTAIAVVLMLSGCIDRSSPQQEPAAPVVLDSAASWEEQVDQVRTGHSDAIKAFGSPVSTEEWAMLADGCDSLEVLEADVRLLTGEDLKVLGTLPHLQRLKLTGPVDDAALTQIADATGLNVLNLPDGLFSDEGMEQLAALKQLELLRFGSPHVTDQGLAVVTRLPALRFLHLIDVPVTDAGLQHLHRLTRLESFYLDGGRCTDQGLHALLQALPQLHFHRDQLHLPDDPHAHPHETSPGSD